MSQSISRVVEEAFRRNEKEIRWRPETFLFPKQLEVFRSKSRYRCNRTGRRGGKSVTWSVCLVDEGIKYPNSTPLFITMSRQDSRDIIWPALQELNKKFNVIPDDGWNRATGDVTLYNGSRIILRGAGTMREINKLRGRKYPCAIIDEAQAFGDDMYYLIDEVLEPATADYHGWLGISGTPGVVPSGPFYEIDQGRFADAWEHFHWTFLENPTMPRPQQFLRKVLERRGWTEDHPGYLREYMGQWVHDESSRAFKINPHRDITARFDPSWASDWDYVMGIDVGYNDPFAFVVFAQSQELHTAFAIDSYEESELNTGEALIVAERLCQKYPITRIAVDTGGAGKLVAQDWVKMSTLPIEAAKKTHKASQISVINGDFQAGKLKICRENNLKLINDLMTLEWDADKAERRSWVYRKGYSDHLADAFQYGYNMCFHHDFNPWTDAYNPEHIDYAHPGSAKWYAKKEAQMEKALIQKVEEKNNPTGTILDELV
jgi:hypothetical protein